MAVLTFDLWQTLNTILQNRLFAETDILLARNLLSLSIDRSISKGCNLSSLSPFLCGRRWTRFCTGSRSMIAIVISSIQLPCPF